MTDPGADQVAVGAAGTSGSTSGVIDADGCRPRALPCALVADTSNV